MHVGNIEWLRDLNFRYRYQLGEARLLELGSLNINGTARDHLEVREWVGIDQEAGPDVDIVCRAAQTKFPPRWFDIVLCTSMLEHDPGWRESLTWNLAWLRRGGLLFLSWGAEGNTHHEPEPWKPVPVADVEAWIENRGLVLVESLWERDRYTADCPGCYNMVIENV